MTPHQSINDLGILVVAATAGKISVMLAQTANAPDWIDRITGPFGALVVMAIGLWYFSRRDAKQDKKMDERQAAKDKEDADHKTAQLETAKQLADTSNAALDVLAVDAVGLLIVGDVVPTGPPVPLGVPVSNVATPVPSPLTPVLIGSPEQLVSVPLVGWPSVPPLTTTEPDDPILIANAVITPDPEDAVASDVSASAVRCAAADPVP